MSICISGKGSVAHQSHPDLIYALKLVLCHKNFTIASIALEMNVLEQA